MKNATAVQILIVIMTLGIVAHSVCAQDERAGVFGEVIDVRVVNLEVVVTENGNRVRGLVADDFVLTVDGIERPLEYFTEVVGGRAVLGGSEVDPMTLPALAPGEKVGTSYLLFLDDYFSLPTDRNRLIDDLIAQLGLLGDEDRMAIVAYDGRKVEMLSTWSQSIPALTRTLENAKQRRAHGLQRQSETRAFDLTRESFEPEQAEQEVTGSFDRLEIDERQQIALITDQVERAVLAASATLRSFASPPGRKVLMLGSGGWPNNPAGWIAGSQSQAIFDSDFRFGVQLYGPLIETANRLSYTVYPIDVPGIPSLGGGGVEVGDVTQASRRERRQFDRNQDEDTTLRTIAHETGGTALINAASSRAFDRIVEDTRSYYWIGFTPNWLGDDQEHRVQVKMRRKGMQVRARKSFSDLSRQTEVSMMVESSLLFGSPPSAAPLVATFGTPSKAGYGKVLLPLTVEVPVSELTFLPDREGLEARIELRVAVLDENGDTADIPVLPLLLKARVQPRAGQIKKFETSVKLRKRKHDIVVSIYDQASGKIISSKMEIDPSQQRTGRGGRT